VLDESVELHVCPWLLTTSGVI